jgi:hypothetical protein
MTIVISRILLGLTSLGFFLIFIPYLRVYRPQSPLLQAVDFISEKTSGEIAVLGVSFLALAIWATICKFAQLGPGNEQQAKRKHNANGYSRPETPSPRSDAGS